MGRILIKSLASWTRRRLSTSGGSAPTPSRGDGTSSTDAISASSPTGAPPRTSSTRSPPSTRGAISAPSSATSSVRLATELLGGRRVLHRQVATEEDAHELVLRGIPAEAMAKLFAGVLSLSSNVLLAAIGVSKRSFARRKAAPKTRLPVDESERLWRFAEVLAHATRVFGSQVEAEQWLDRPAIGLDHRKPIDLLRTHPGTRLVSEHLTRIEHGVYA